MHNVDIRKDPEFNPKLQTIMKSIYRDRTQLQMPTSLPIKKQVLFLNKNVLIELSDKPIWGEVWPNKKLAIINNINMLIKVVIN